MILKNVTPCNISSWIEKKYFGLENYKKKPTYYNGFLATIHVNEFISWINILDKKNYKSITYAFQAKVIALTELVPTKSILYCIF